MISVHIMDGKNCGEVAYNCFSCHIAICKYSKNTAWEAAFKATLPDVKIK